MAEIIDELIISLGLDAAKFTAGQKKTIESLKKLENESSRSAKSMEASGKQAAQFFSSIKAQAIGLLAVFAGATGLSSFLNKITATDSSVGLLANNLGISVDKLTAWQGAAERTGGSAQATAGSIQGLVNNLQGLTLLGDTKMLPFLAMAGVNMAKFSDKSTSVSEKLLMLSDAFVKLSPERRQFIGGNLGLDQGTINLLGLGRDKVSSLLSEQERLGVTQKKNAESALALENAWKDLRQPITDLGRQILTVATPAIVDLLTKMSDWISKNKEFLTKKISDEIGRFVDFLTKVDWDKVAGDIKSVAAAIGWIIDKAGGAHKVIMGLIALFLGSKLLGVAKVFWNIGKAIFGIGSAISRLISKSLSKLFGFFKIVAKGASVLGPSILDGLLSGLGKIGDVLKNILKKTFRFLPGVGAAFTFGETLYGGELNEGEDESLDNIPGYSGAKESRGRNKVTPHPELAGEAMNFFMSKGWSKEAAAGIVANIRHESGFDYQAIGDNGQAFGLAQWHNDRQEKFKKWAGFDITDPRATFQKQMEFIDYELKHEYSAAGDALRRAKTAEEAGKIASDKYEIPKDEDGGKAEERARTAQQYYRMRPKPDQSLNSGATAAPAITNNKSTSSTSTSSTDVNIGTLNIQTQARDSDGIAASIRPAIARNIDFSSANRGLV